MEKTTAEKRKKVGKVIIDNGHGIYTAGKCSPDGKLREWKWTRDVAVRLQKLLEARGFDVELLVPEASDVPLRDRVRRATAIGKKAGGQSRCLLISLHVNAAGSGGWHTASGWSVYVCGNASLRSRQFANTLARHAKEKGLKVRRQTPGRGYWVQSLAIVRDTLCPVVLSENLFMDNEEECRWLLSEEGKDTIALLHADAVSEFEAA